MPTKSPIVLDKQNKILLDRLNSISAALWAEKNPEVPSKDVNFYDYDGTIVYSYTRFEFLCLSELPGYPAHEGLIAQGWNWTLQAAQEYVEKYGVLDIGQSYITDDGKTRLYIEIGYTENLTANLRFNQSAAEAVTIDWGDGNTEVAATSGDVTMTHTYAEEGKYVITMTVAEEESVRLGTNTASGTTLVNVGGTSNMFFFQGHGRIAGKDALYAVEIGAGVTDIGSAAFGYCTSLKFITIPKSVEVIRDFAFWACKNLEAMVIPSGITGISSMQHGYNYALKAISIPSSVESIGNSAFKTCTELRRLCIPEGVETLLYNVCSGMHSAKDIIIPDTITGAIPVSAFDNCYGIEKINIPSGVTSIGKSAFSNCYNLRKCLLPEGLTSIGETAFASCFGFHDFVIPSTVTSIGKFAFIYNDGTASFRVKATTPPTIEPTAFTEVYGAIIIYVPYSEDHSILEAYKAATGWCSWADSMVEDDPVEGDTSNTDDVSEEEEGDTSNTDDVSEEEEGGTE